MNLAKPIRSLSLIAIISGLLVAAPAVHAAGNSNVTVLSSPLAQSAEPITHYAASTSLVSTLDPQKAEDLYSIDPVENLFLGLTDVDPMTGEIRPEIATEWSQNDAGDVWTFTIRTDVPWVKYNTNTKEISEIRKVTAEDFVYGIKRSCDPRLGAYYTGVAAGILKGCDVASQIAADKFQPSDLDQVGVKAIGENKIEITLQGSFAFFLQTSGMWMFRAVPKEAIEESGDKWATAGNLITNGAYVVSEWDPNVNLTLIANPYYPKDIHDKGEGNMERSVTIFVPDQQTILTLYKSDAVDSAGVPRGDLKTTRADEKLSKELSARVDLGTYYFGIATEKPPFDKPEVRRAFSAVMDRNAIVSEVNQGAGVPIAHFMPPGIFGAVAVNEAYIGSPDNPGYDVEYAKKQMAAAGYPDCKDFPNISILTTSSRATFAEFVQNAAVQKLGCDVNKIKLDQAEFSVLKASTTSSTPTEQRPNLWYISWFADYADAQNWVHDVLSCKVNNDFKRACSPLDDIIDAAAKETDLDKRAKMYADVEKGLFGADGEFPIIPLWIAQTYTLYKPWYTGPFNTDAIFGGSHYELYKIDQAAQLAARGGANVPLVAPTLVPTEEATAAK